MTEREETQSLSRSKARGHEERDIALRPIVLGAIGIAALVIVAALGMRGLFDVLLTREIRSSPAANPLSLEAGKRLPPEPRLLPQPIEQLRILRAEEDGQLETYGWVDRSQGVVRIPIERAMELVVERGVRVEEESTRSGVSPE